ncbi:hypothetical protein pb186bvf_012604 [Paramecium bursaria]
MLTRIEERLFLLQKQEMPLQSPIKQNLSFKASTTNYYQRNFKSSKSLKKDDNKSRPNTPQFDLKEIKFESQEKQFQLDPQPPRDERLQYTSFMGRDIKIENKLLKLNPNYLYEPSAGLLKYFKPELLEQVQLSVWNQHGICIFKNLINIKLLNIDSIRIEKENLVLSEDLKNQEHFVQYFTRPCSKFEIQKIIDLQKLQQ